MYGETEAYVNKVYDLLERALAMRGVAPHAAPLDLRPLYGHATAPDPDADRHAHRDRHAHETATSEPTATATPTASPTVTASATATPTATRPLAHGHRHDGRDARPHRHRARAGLVLTLAPPRRRSRRPQRGRPRRTGTAPPAAPGGTADSGHATA